MGKSLETVGSKPIGLKGLIAGRLMNVIHSRLYKDVIHKYIVTMRDKSENLEVLDLGCGGGIAVKIFSQCSGVNKVYGIDYSSEMVSLSQSVNQKCVKAGLVEIVEGDVLDMPLKASSVDIVTAFDTINFWPDQNKAFVEIKRVLKSEGWFVIVNAYPKEGSRWYDFVKYKDEHQYKNALTSSGFINVEAVFEKNSIIVYGQKQSCSTCTI